MKSKILVTGFEPFESYKINSSWEAAKEASKLRNAINAVLLPVDYEEAHNQLESSLNKLKPDILLLCGLAPISALKLELLARKPNELSSVKGYPRRHGKWPWNQTICRLRNKNITVSLSSDAGQYVCESTYWSALNYRNKNKFPRYVAFLHVPPLSDIWTAKILAKEILEILDAVTEGLVGENTHNESAN